MPLKSRAFTSFLLALAFLGATISGVVLYVAPRGRTASQLDWSMLGMSMHDWTALHINMCVLLLVVSAIHLYYNWRLFCSYFNKAAANEARLSQEMVLAVLFTAVVGVGSYLDLPPFSAITDFRYRMKVSWEQRPDAVGNAAADEAEEPATVPGHILSRDSNLMESRRY